MFLEFSKIPDKTSAWSSFLQKKALIGPLPKSCYKQLFGKFPGRPASVLKRTSPKTF